MLKWHDEDLYIKLFIQTTLEIIILIEESILLQHT